MLATSALRVRPQVPAPSARAPAAAATPTDEPRDRVILASVYMQDPLVDRRDGPQEIRVPAAFLQVRGDRLEGPHFSAVDDRSPRTLTPDADGNFIFPAHTPAFDVVDAQVHAEKTVAMYESMLGQPIRWDFGDARRPRVAIKVDRHDPDGSHGDLDGKRMVLDCYPSRELHTEVRAAESLEMVAHETGHFVLHALRPGLSDKDLETRAFHESFSDITAMLYALQYDDNVSRMARTTRGHWSRNNLISEFAEQDGKATQLRHYPADHIPHHIRSAVNDYAYVPPDQEPASDKEYSNRSISSEPHDFSQIFTGAFYDALTAVADRAHAQGMNLPDSIRAGRDRMQSIWGEALQHLPDHVIRYAQVAQLMVDADRKLGGDEVAILKQAFQDRDIACR